MSALNPVRLLADTTHAASTIILIVAIIRNKSAEGVSLLTQSFYTLVFLARYTDLAWAEPGASDLQLWNFCFKIFYIVSSFAIVFLMLRVYPRSREKEGAWKIAIWSFIGCIVTTPIVSLIFNGFMFSVSEWFWVFSIELESVCILPQLLLLRQTSVPTVLDSYYLVALGSYRLIYIINWIVRAANGGKPNTISVIFGVVQTLLYLDFAWVYYSRQRVKLRGGAVIDSDDLGKSVLVRRLIGTKSHDPEDDEVEDHAPLTGDEEQGTGKHSNSGSNRWGARGISVSADDTLHEHDKRNTYKIADPSRFEDDDDDDQAPPPPAKNDADVPSLSSSANAWKS